MRIHHTFSNLLHTPQAQSCSPRHTRFDPVRRLEHSLAVCDGFQPEGYEEIAFPYLFIVRGPQFVSVQCFVFAYGPPNQRALDACFPANLSSSGSPCNSLSVVIPDLPGAPVFDAHDGEKRATSIRSFEKCGGPDRSKSPSCDVIRAGCYRLQGLQ